jgi:predicted alpha/beta superfamily hydrolase
MSLIATYEPIIKIIDEDYLIPQLNRRRRIAAILPYDYEYSDKYYPVLYLHDGQNLFDDYAPFGNWGVDKCLTILSSKGIDIIIIAIDHGGKDRIAEYLPYETPRYTDAQGDEYVRFMMEDLKPHIDKNFRVKTERQFTGIGGSSMGGLISLYAGFQYNEVFSKLLIFSPSLWITDQAFYQAMSFVPKGMTDIYFYAGGKESKSLLPTVNKMIDILKSRKYSEHFFNITSKINPEGKHQEYFWGNEFPSAIEWLFHKTILNDKN